MSYWIESKFFIECSKCKYEIIKGDIITAPKHCPNCNRLMLAIFTEEELKSL